MITVKDIYEEINRRIPFCTAEDWDNSGFLAGDPDCAVTKALTALDITKDVIEEAEREGAQLIISHHPVIFHPLRIILRDSAAGMLLQKNISAICTHTPFDMSPLGMAKGLYEILEKPLGLIRSSEEPLEVTGENLSIGKIYLLRESLPPKECAERLKKALGCEYVRLSRGGKSISKIAVCSGAGGSEIPLAMEKGADGLVSGDFKHDQFTDAQSSGFVLFDCGHFHTERIFAGLMCEMLSEAFPSLTVQAAESCVDPVLYI